MNPDISTDPLSEKNRIGNALITTRLTPTHISSPQSLKQSWGLARYNHQPINGNSYQHLRKCCRLFCFPFSHVRHRQPSRVGFGFSANELSASLVAVQLQAPWNSCCRSQLRILPRVLMATSPWMIGSSMASSTKRFVDGTTTRSMHRTIQSSCGES